MDALAMQGKGRQEGRARERAWQPRWAVVLAVVAVAIMLVPLWYSIALLVEGASAADETGSQIAGALGSVVLVVTALALVPLGLFLWRGGRVPFLGGTCVAALALLYWGVTVL